MPAASTLRLVPVVLARQVDEAELLLRRALPQEVEVDRLGRRLRPRQQLGGAGRLEAQQHVRRLDLDALAARQFDLQCECRCRTAPSRPGTRRLPRTGRAGPSSRDSRSRTCGCRRSHASRQPAAARRRPRRSCLPWNPVYRRRPVRPAAASGDVELGAAGDAQQVGGRDRKHVCGVPPAAQTSSKRRSELSMKVTIGRACPSGATPPIAKPLCSRTNSGARTLDRFAEQRRDLRFVDAPVAGGDHQHRAPRLRRRGTPATWRSARPRCRARQPPAATCAPPR